MLGTDGGCVQRSRSVAVSINAAAGTPRLGFSSRFAARYVSGLELVEAPSGVAKVRVPASAQPALVMALDASGDPWQAALVDPDSAGQAMNASSTAVAAGVLSMDPMLITSVRPRELAMAVAAAPSLPALTSEVGAAVMRRQSFVGSDPVRRLATQVAREASAALLADPDAPRVSAFTIETPFAAVSGAHGRLVLLDGDGTGVRVLNDTPLQWVLRTLDATGTPLGAPVVIPARGFDPWTGLAAAGPPAEVTLPGVDGWMKVAWGQNSRTRFDHATQTVHLALLAWAKLLGFAPAQTHWETCTHTVAAAFVTARMDALSTQPSGEVALRGLFAALADPGAWDEVHKGLEQSCGLTADGGARPPLVAFSRLWGHADVAGWSGGRTGFIQQLIEHWGDATGNDLCQTQGIVVPGAAQVQLETGQVALAVGRSLLLGAMPVDASGRPLNDRLVRWSSDKPTIVDVAADGTATGVAIGNATITAATCGASATIAVTVGDRPKSQVGEPCADVQECVPDTICFNRFCVGKGHLRISLAFDPDSDFDLHVMPPNGPEISYSNRTGAGGTLDVDQCVDGCGAATHVENVVFDNQAPAGTYTVWVVNYDGRAGGAFTIDVAGAVNQRFTSTIDAASGSSSERFTFVYAP